MDYTELIRYLQALQPAMLEALRDLVEHESPTGDKARLDVLARRLQERFRAAGAEVALLANDDAGDHLRVLFPPGSSAGAARPALLLCHFDTVWPAGTLAKRPFRVEAGRARGPGVYDMKAGIVLSEFALRAIGELGLELPRAAVVLLTSDEEGGSATSRALIEEQARQAEYVLVLESPLPGGVLKTARKGVGHFTLEVEGRAAHSGVEPEKGVNAVYELARQVLYLHSLSDAEQGTTVNVNVFHGGTRSNVVAAYAEAQVDVRVWTPEEARRVEVAILQARPVTSGAVIRVRGGFGRPPLECTAAVAALFHRAQEIGRDLGLELQAGATGGGSDGNFTAALGVPTLDGLGALGDGAHAYHEHIVVDSLPLRAALLAALLTRL